MRCPYCGHDETRVVDSRVGKDAFVIRRRRECDGCTKRFTTYERIEEITPLIIKKDGRREPFDPAKLVRGITNACHKRPVSAAAIEGFVDALLQRLQDKGIREITSREVGEDVMTFLHGLDQVAFVRFASVYRSFKDVDEFMAEVAALKDKQRNASGEPS